MRIRYSAAKDGRPVKKALVYTRDEHGIEKGRVDPDALRVVEQLRANGHETYIVGGAVRDLIIGKRPKDFDIVTDASPTRIKRLFRNSRIIGRRFRLVHVFFGPKIFEVSTFRSLVDGTVSNTYGTIDEDVQRRDFTLNALFYDPHDEVVVDYVGGFADIGKRRVEPVIPLKVIFVDDPVRMLRAAKYAATTGFSLSFFLKRKIKSQAALLAPVSPSRLTEEILKIIHSGKSREIVEKMDSLGLYRYLQGNAVILMHTRPLFREHYLESLSEMDKLSSSRAEAATGPVSGKLLSFMIRDFLDTRVDWETETGAAYRDAFAECRSFVLPMNPPRIELENAVRLLFREHGIGVKKARTFEKGEEKTLLPDVERLDGEAPQTAAKRRRRRRRRSGAPAPSSEST